MATTILFQSAMAYVQMFMAHKPKKVQIFGATEKMALMLKNSGLEQLNFL